MAGVTAQKCGATIWPADVNVFHELYHAKIFVPIIEMLQSGLENDITYLLCRRYQDSNNPSVLESR